MKLVKAIETPPPSRKIKCNNAKEPQSVYYCHLCGSEYIMKYNLEVHLERQHKEEERNALPQSVQINMHFKSFIKVTKLFFFN